MVYGVVRYRAGRPGRQRLGTRDPGPTALLRRDMSDVAIAPYFQKGSADRAGEGSASDIDSGNRRLEGDDDGYSLGPFGTRHNRVVT